MTLFTLGPIPGKGQTFNYRNQQEALGPRCIRPREKLCGFFFPFLLVLADLNLKYMEKYYALGFLILKLTPFFHIL